MRCLKCVIYRSAGMASRSRPPCCQAVLSSPYPVLYKLKFVSKLQLDSNYVVTSLE